MLCDCMDVWAAKSKSGRGLNVVVDGMVGVVW